MVVEDVEEAVGEAPEEEEDGYWVESVVGLVRYGDGWERHTEKIRDDRLTQGQVRRRHDGIVCDSDLAAEESHLGGESLSQRNVRVK